MRPAIRKVIPPAKLASRIATRNLRGARRETKARTANRRSNRNSKGNGGPPIARAVADGGPEKHEMSNSPNQRCPTIALNQQPSNGQGTPQSGTWHQPGATEATSAANREAIPTRSKKATQTASYTAGSRARHERAAKGSGDASCQRGAGSRGARGQRV